MGFLILRHWQLFFVIGSGGNLLEFLEVDRVASYCVEPYYIIDLPIAFQAAEWLLCIIIIYIL